MQWPTELLQQQKCSLKFSESETSKELNCCCVCKVKSDSKLVFVTACSNHNIGNHNVRWKIIIKNFTNFNFRKIKLRRRSRSVIYQQALNVLVVVRRKIVKKLKQRQGKMMKHKCNEDTNKVNKRIFGEKQKQVKL